MEDMNMKNVRNSKKVFNLIIVDESGSMDLIRNEALVGMNETLTTCQKMEALHPELEQMVTLITFDSDHFKMHYDNVPASKTRQLTGRDYKPAGGTPLYDAIGMGVSKVNAQTGVDDHVLVTIITDGEENCSRLYTLTMIKNLIEKQKKAGWTFTLIGTDNLDVESMAGAMAIENHLAFREDQEGTREMFRRERVARERYNKHLCANDIVVESRMPYFRDND